MKNKTLLIIKPDIVKKKSIGKIITFLEDHNIKIINLKMFDFSKTIADKFYNEHKNKPFYNELIDFIISGSVVILILGGVDIINKTRDIIGHTDPQKAKNATIRKYFATDLTQNAVHASDSFESFVREYKIVFDEE